ncbi:hypothetical protein B484DRAFT_397275 [Ochromonadaceae sp. CCMP2298]|nr:hypothetical protein B484DRAFT_397275 [Ochromonadaceae sp. CCMP2298]
MAELKFASATSRIQSAERAEAERLAQALAGADAETERLARALAEAVTEADRLARALAESESDLRDAWADDSSSEDISKDEQPQQRVTSSSSSGDSSTDISLEDLLTRVASLRIECSEEDTGEIEMTKTKSDSLQRVWRESLSPDSKALIQTVVETAEQRFKSSTMKIAFVERATRHIMRDIEKVAGLSKGARTRHTLDASIVDALKSFLAAFSTQGRRTDAKQRAVHIPLTALLAELPVKPLQRRLDIDLRKTLKNLAWWHQECRIDTWKKGLITVSVYELVRSLSKLRKKYVQKDLHLRLLLRLLLLMRLLLLLPNGDSRLRDAREDVSVAVRVFEVVPRTTADPKKVKKKDRTEKELVEKMMTGKEIMADTLVIMTDFSANFDCDPSARLNSATSEHALLDVFLYNCRKNCQLLARLAVKSQLKFDHVITPTANFKTGVDGEGKTVKGRMR